MKISILILLIFLIIQPIAEAENVKKNLWQITFYCACDICINNPANRDGLTASGFPLNTETNIAANNFLPFGARVQIEGWGEYIIVDRGSQKYFGRPEDKVEHIDIFVADHNLAVKLGVQYREVVVK